ncbi:3-oxoacyl-ACP reductase FabG [Kitasatospora sp. NPDC056731]|uniref:3-oxoacyl-ACP reductase FabG n=1 Tax=Kitasatospora sp. NPDC056731 TaxID=3155422 RepID=UPI0034470699
MSRSVLVTGGNRGIGLEVARTFAEAGEKVAVTYRSGEPPAGLFGVRCDVTDPQSVERAFAEVEAQQGPVEVLVANAGATRDMLMLGMSEEDFAAVIETNLMGAFRVARRAAVRMATARWGRVLLVSSTVGMAGSPGQTNYAASKSALIGLARSMCWELGRRNITVNVVAPGLIETDMIAHLTPERRAELVARTALRRPGTAAEVAAVVRFLASEEASFVTGAVVPVGGGHGMGH